MTEITVEAADITLETSIEVIRRVVMRPESREALSPLQLMVASEVAYRAADYAVGIEALVELVARLPDEAVNYVRLGHFKRLAGEEAAAEQNFRRALALDPDLEPAYHELRELLAQRGDIDGALDVLARQARHFGESTELRLAHIGLLKRAGRLEAAWSSLQPMLAKADAPEGVLRCAAELSLDAGRIDDAITSAQTLAQRFPEPRANRVLLAHLLCAGRRFADVIPLLQELLKSDKDDVDLLRLLSTALAVSGRYREALDAAIRTTQLRPTESEFWYHAAALANILGHADKAIEWLLRALELDPNSVTLLTSQAQLLAQLGRLEDALAAMDRAKQLDPQAPSIRDLHLMLLARTNEEFVVTDRGSDLIKPLPMTRRLGSIPSFEPHEGYRRFLESFRIQCRVIIALVMREMAHRTAHSRFGLMSAVVEPLLQVVMLGVVLTIFNNGLPPIGNNLFFFYSTGVMPFYLLLHIVDHTMNIYTDHAYLLQVSRIRRIDLVIATALTELLIGGITTTLVFSLFFAFGYGESLDNIAQAVIAYFAVWLFAFGIGLIGSVANNLSKVWQQSWITISRMLYFLSGIFFVPQMMPAWARDILVWNPLLVGVEWFRSGFFTNYSPPWIDKSYMISISLACIVIGVALERGLRRRLRTTTM